MSTVPPSDKPGRAQIVIARAILLSPFALVGVGVGLISLPAGLVTAGLMLWVDLRRRVKP